MLPQRVSNSPAAPIPPRALLWVNVQQPRIVGTKSTEEECARQATSALHFWHIDKVRAHEWALRRIGTRMRGDAR